MVGVQGSRPAVILAPIHLEALLIELVVDFPFDGIILPSIHVTEVADGSELPQV